MGQSHLYLGCLRCMSHLCSCPTNFLRKVLQSREHDKLTVYYYTPSVKVNMNGQAIKQLERPTIVVRALALTTITIRLIVCNRQ